MQHEDRFLKFGAGMRVGIPRGRSDMSDSEKNSGYAEGLVVYVSWNLEFMLMNGGENKAVK